MASNEDTELTAAIELSKWRLLTLDVRVGSVYLGPAQKRVPDSDYLGHVEWQAWDGDIADLNVAVDRLITEANDANRTDWRRVTPWTMDSKWMECWIHLGECPLTH